MALNNNHPSPSDYRNGQYDSYRYGVLMEEYDSQPLEREKKEDRLMSDLVRIANRLSYPLELTGNQHETTALVLVDYQNDYVRGPASCFREDLTDYQAKMAMLYRTAQLWNTVPFRVIVYVQHWHPPNSALFATNHQCSYKNEAKYFPVHCLQDSFGAELSSDWSKYLGAKCTNPPFGSYIYSVYVGTKRGNTTLRQCPLQHATQINGKRVNEHELTQLLRKHNTSHAFVCALNAEECGITTCISLQSAAISTYLVLDCSKTSMCKHDNMGEFLYKCIGKKPPRKEWKIISSDDLRGKMGEKWQPVLESGLRIHFQEEDNPKSRKKKLNDATSNEPERNKSSVVSNEFYRITPMNATYVKPYRYVNTIEESLKNYLIQEQGGASGQQCSENEEMMQVDKAVGKGIKLDRRAKHWLELSSSRVPALGEDFDFSVTTSWSFDLPNKKLKRCEPPPERPKIRSVEKSNMIELKDLVFDQEYRLRQYEANCTSQYAPWDAKAMALESLRIEREILGLDTHTGSHSSKHDKRRK